MDFSVPRNLPPALQEKLASAVSDFNEGYLTEKGYIKKRNELLEKFSNMSSTDISSNPSVYLPSTPGRLVNRMSVDSHATLPLSSNSGYIPSHQRSETIGTLGSLQFSEPDFKSEYLTESVTTSSPSHGQYNYYTDEYEENDSEPFTRYYNNGPIGTTQPSQLQEPKELQKPLDPRDVQQLAPDSNTGFQSLPKLLRSRGGIYGRETAILIIDSRGKESQAISWEKLYLRAEKIAHQIKNKAALYPGDRVCLIYQSGEIIDFVVALYGCFLSGTVAVPMSSKLPVRELVKIMTDTQSHLCLMSDTVYRHYDKVFHQNRSSVWPKGMDIWKTTDMGTYQPSRKQEPTPIKVNDLAYIEYTKSSIGELRGVVISHRTIMNQMRSLSSILKSMPDLEDTSFIRSDAKFQRAKNVTLSTLDCCESFGLVGSALFTIYTGNMFIWTPQRSTEVAGLYANIISRYKVSILLSDYLSLKQVAYNYQSFPQLTRTFNKKVKVDLSWVKWCLISTPTVDCEFNEMLSDRWFRPLGNKNPRKIVAPILCLNDHGGSIISMRDWIGNKEHLGCVFHKPMADDANNDEFDDYSNDDDGDGELGETSDGYQDNRLSEVLIDKESLATNSVKIVTDRPPPSTKIVDTEESSKYIRVGAFGYPFPDATLAIVNPETKFLSGVLEVGEIWVDSHCISGGFWNLPEDTQAIFQAECSDYEGILNLKFVRTGLLGFTYNGRIYVLGPYEDRISRQVTWYDQYQVDHGNSTENIVDVTKFNDYRYYYSSHLVKTLARNIPDVTDGSFFNIKINKEYVPIAVIESPAAKSVLVGTNAATAASTSVNKKFDEPTLNLIANKSFQLLEKIHNLRPYCLLITPPDVLPRTLRSGRYEISNMLTKRKFSEGRIVSSFVRFNFPNSVSCIAHGDDIEGGVFSKYSSHLRSETLSYAELQYSGLDFREHCVDDKANLDLSKFESILNVLKKRAADQGEEQALAMIESAGSKGLKDSKQLSWRKLENRILAVCLYLLEKQNLKSGDHVILNYPMCEEYIICLYACWLSGYKAIPLPPIDSDPMLIDEDCNAFVKIVKQYKVKAIFVNNETEHAMKNKPISSKLKASAQVQKILLPKLRNTTKHTKNQFSSTTVYKRMSSYRKGNKFEEGEEVLIWIIFDSDHAYNSIKLSHNSIMNMCKTLKETCQLSSLKPLLACVRHHFGLGFLQAAVLGIFLGAETYLITPVEYFTNTSNFYLCLSRYKIENVYMTDMMLLHAKRAIKNPNVLSINLSNMKNMMIGWSNRPNFSIVDEFIKKFQVWDISANSIANVYQHMNNPFISLRSYLNFDPVNLWIDPIGLSQGYISLVNPNDSPNSIKLQDSGVVSVNTQLVIVNPETRKICKVGEFGEIWTCSESTTITNKLDKVEGWDKDLSYFRTGDFGFLHNVTKSNNRSGAGHALQPIELQLLYNLGKIEETFEQLGLLYFVQDLEYTIESVFYEFVANAMVAKIGNYVILFIESVPKLNKSLSSLVPLFVNKILSKFGLITDIVAFAELPVSRIGENQRYKTMRRFLNGSLRVKGSYGVNFGEGANFNSVKLIDSVIHNIQSH